MSCCSKSKFVVGAVVLGLGAAALVATGVGPALCHRVVAKIQKQVPPEVQIEQLKIDISKLDVDIDKNWGPIASYEREIKDLRKDMQVKQEKVKSMEKELAAATDELEAKTVKVKYDGREYSRADAGKLLNTELNRFTSLKREVASKEKLLAAREQKLDAAMKTQKEMMSQKEELKTQVAQLEADLETLKLIRTEKKLPIGEKNRLDGIKAKLNQLQTTVDDEVRANQLREQFQNGTTGSEAKEKIDADAVVTRVRKALGQEGNVAKDE